MSNEDYQRGREDERQATSERRKKILFGISRKRWLLEQEIKRLNRKISEDMEAFRDGRPCIQCGKCCRELYLFDRLRISWATRTVMLRKVCRFLDGDYCGIHPDKPDICKAW